MRHFCTIALFLGCISVVCFQTQSVQAASNPQTKDDTKLQEVMRYYFQNDHVQSPLKNGQGQDSAFALTEAIAGYMRKADTAQLKKLFYEPDFNTWADLYRQVTNEPCSTVGLITLLDETKDRIFKAYQGQDVEGGNVYTHMTFLFDEAMKQIFEGCWGISNQSIEPTVINRLKQVYARAVAMELETDDRRLKTLGEKAKAQPQQAAHYRALQECAAAVVYTQDTFSHGNDIGKFIKQKNLSLNQGSFQAVLGIITLPEPWQGDVSRHFLSFSKPGDFQAQQFGDDPFKPFDPLAPLAPALNPLVKAILDLDVTNSPKASKVQQAIFQIIDNSPLKSVGSTDKISSLTSDEQEQLLDQFIKTLDWDAYFATNSIWSQFFNTNGFDNFFDKELLARKLVEGIFQIREFNLTTSNREPVKISQIGNRVSFIFRLISLRLPETVDGKVRQEQMVGLVKILLERLYPNRTPQEEADFWTEVLPPIGDKTLLEARPLIREGAFYFLNNIPIVSGKENDLQRQIYSFYKKLDVAEKKKFKQEINQNQYFKKLSPQQRQAVFKDFNW